VADSTDNTVMRNAAIHAIGVSQGDKETDYLQKFLKHPDSRTRLAAAQTLQKIVDVSLAAEQAKKVLAEYKTNEKEAWAVKRLAGEYPKSVVTAQKQRTKEEASLQKNFAGQWK